MPLTLDATDKLLLSALQGDARLTSAELAERAHLSQSPCWRRIKRLEESGLIAGYGARLDRRTLGWGVMAFVTITIDSQDERLSVAFEAAVRDIPEVVMCHGVSGPEDFILVVVAQDLDAYSALMQHKLRRMPGVKLVRTSFSLQEVKAMNGIPIPP